MTLSVTIDPADKRRLVFSQAVTLAQAIAFLWSTPPKSPNALRLDPAERPTSAGTQRRFIIDTSNQDALLGLRGDLMFQYITVTPIRAAEPPPLPAWLPLNVREQILGFSLPDGVTRFSGTAPWGDIVVWIRRGSGGGCLHAEVYQEFPETIDYYLGFTDGDHWTANILLKAYTQFNSDMSYFVERKGKSPSEAKAELRRINDEVLKLVLEASATIMTSAAGVSAVTGTMRELTPKITAAARRSLSPTQLRIRPVNGQVNVGGGFETPHMTNLNPIKPGSGGPKSNIPNHVRAPMEAMDDIFEPGSVTYVYGRNLLVDDFDWPRAAQAAANVMPPGAKVFMNVRDADEMADAIIAAFEAAGFTNASVKDFGPGALIMATR